MRRPLHQTAGYFGSIAWMFLGALIGGMTSRGRKATADITTVTASPERSTTSPSVARRRARIIPQGIKADPEAIRRARVRMMCTGPAQWMHLGVRTPLQGIRSKRKGRGIGGRARRRGMAR
jgi:hypothetical protein